MRISCVLFVRSFFFRVVFTLLCIGGPGVCWGAQSTLDEQKAALRGRYPYLARYTMILPRWSGRWFSRWFGQNCYEATLLDIYAYDIYCNERQKAANEQSSNIDVGNVNAYGVFFQDPVGIANLPIDHTNPYSDLKRFFGESYEKLFTYCVDQKGVSRDSFNSPEQCFFACPPSRNPFFSFDDCDIALRIRGEDGWAYGEQIVDFLKGNHQGDIEVCILPQLTYFDILGRLQNVSVEQDIAALHAIYREQQFLARIPQKASAVSFVCSSLLLQLVRVDVKDLLSKFYTCLQRDDRELGQIDRDIEVIESEMQKVGAEDQGLSFFGGQQGPLHLSDSYTKYNALQARLVEKKKDLAALSKREKKFSASLALAKKEAGNKENIYKEVQGICAHMLVGKVDKQVMLNEAQKKALEEDVGGFTSGNIRSEIQAKLKNKSLQDQDPYLKNLCSYVSQKLDEITAQEALLNDLQNRCRGVQGDITYLQQQFLTQKNTILSILREFKKTLEQLRTARLVQLKEEVEELEVRRQLLERFYSNQMVQSFHRCSSEGDGGRCGTLGDGAFSSFFENLCVEKARVQEIRDGFNGDVNNNVNDKELLENFFKYLENEQGIVLPNQNQEDAYLVQRICASVITYAPLWILLALVGMASVFYDKIYYGAVSLRG